MIMSLLKFCKFIFDENILFYDKMILGKFKLDSY